MLRVIDVSKAGKAGLSFGHRNQLHLEVKDDLLPENNGKFVLSVANGQGVKRGGLGELKLDVRFRPPSTRLFTPHHLQLIGQWKQKKQP